jgi:hypothetical protein
MAARADARLKECAMKNVISLTGHVLVSDILAAFEPMVSEETLLTLDKELKHRSDERLMFDDVEVQAEEAIDTLDDAGKLPEPESLTYTLDRTTVIGLAEAIRCGEREQAELLLDLLFADTAEFDTIREWIDRGRYSRKARAAKATDKPAQLRAA